MRRQVEGSTKAHSCDGGFTLRNKAENSHTDDIRANSPLMPFSSLTDVYSIYPHTHTHIYIY